MRIACAITLTDKDRAILERWSRSRSTEARLVERARIVLLAAEGRENKDIAVELGVTRATVGRWRDRFAARGMVGIEKDAPRGGRPPKTRDDLAEKIIEMTTRQKPANATHWSTRTLAEVLGTNRSMVSRVWRANGLKPHLSRTFKVSNDPKFAEKLVDVVGLYLDTPEHALVLCVDEKSQIYDYKRNGTTTLFAALNVAEGRLIGQCMPRHRHQEFIKFLKQIDAETPPDLDLHLIVDNYATHKHTNVVKWLKRHPRFHMHFIPTSSSWLNLVERWFREITDKRIRRGVFKSVEQLIAAIQAYIENNNSDPKPFVWAAKAEDILEKVGRARAVLDKIASD